MWLENSGGTWGEWQREEISTTGDYIIRAFEGTESGFESKYKGFKLCLLFEQRKQIEGYSVSKVTTVEQTPGESLQSSVLKRLGCLLCPLPCGFLSRIV